MEKTDTTYPCSYQTQPQLPPAVEQSTMPKSLTMRVNQLVYMAQILVLLL